MITPASKNLTKIARVVMYFIACNGDCHSKRRKWRGGGCGPAVSVRNGVFYSYNEPVGRLASVYMPHSAMVRVLAVDRTYYSNTTSRHVSRIHNVAVQHNMVVVNDTEFVQGTLPPGTDMHARWVQQAHDDLLKVAVPLNKRVSNMPDDKILGMGYWQRILIAYAVSQHRRLKDGDWHHDTFVLPGVVAVFPIDKHGRQPAVVATTPTKRNPTVRFYAFPRRGVGACFADFDDAMTYVRMYEH